MSGRLEHSPARVVQEYLILNGFGTDPDDWPDDGTDIPNGVWPIYRSRDPDRPDDLIQVNGATGRGFGYTQPDKERQEVYGIQIIVRSFDEAVGHLKASNIAVALDRINREIITLAVSEAGSGTGSAGSTYLLQSVERASEATYEGRDTPQGKRNEYSINCLVTLRQCFPFPG